MKYFVKGMLTNRFGIFLAALNLCYFMSRNFVHFIFEHKHGEGNCLFFNILIGFDAGTAKSMLNINSPAIVLSFFPNRFMQVIFSDFCAFTDGKFQVVFLMFFITLQWLFIGWMAKVIARRIQPTNS